ncbi:MAG: hypothetical protein IJ936_04295, partial [Peptococcaceae bacterium]|nr:hypothetical protein [Peptococcaceae bacterium]
MLQLDYWLQDENIPWKQYQPKIDEIHNKLNNKEDLKILFYGDSITTGCNASSQSRSEPNMPFFDKMV